jgi:hypothetical protein
VSTVPPVLGDALGNVGVIAAGLVIWLCEGQWRFYVSTCPSSLGTLLLSLFAPPCNSRTLSSRSLLPLSSSALLFPLASIRMSSKIRGHSVANGRVGNAVVKSASFILLQAVPSSIDLDDLRASILDVPGVVSVHEVGLPCPLPPSLRINPDASIYGVRLASLLAALRVQGRRLGPRPHPARQGLHGDRSGDPQDPSRLRHPFVDYSARVWRRRDAYRGGRKLPYSVPPGRRLRRRTVLHARAQLDRR